MKFTLGKRSHSRARLYETIRESGLFDSNWYRATYPDIAASRMDPVAHYVRFGAAEGRNPSPFFDSNKYFNENEAVRAAKINPLAHYIETRRSSNNHAAPSSRDNDRDARAVETIRESGLFDAAWYRTTYPDVAASGMDAIEHYVKFGAAEGRQPSPQFDGLWYLSENYEIQATGKNPLVHYIESGRPPYISPIPLNEGQKFEALNRAFRAGLLNSEKIKTHISAVHFGQKPPQARDNASTPPLPPLPLCRRVGSLTHEDFLRIGQQGRTAIMRSLPPAFSFQGARCLDFGCGVGRVIRHFKKDAEVSEFWGCDIDGTSILWNNENLSPPFRFFQLSDAPTLPLESSSFDLVYALAVFSQVFHDWNALAMEIRRILKPGGVFFMSFNGQFSTEDLFRMSYYDLIRETGMYVRGPFDAWNKGGPNVTLSPAWIKTHWGAIFDIDFIAMNGFEDYQSFCIMRKPHPGARRKSEPPVLELGTTQAFNASACGMITPRFDASRPFLESYGIEGAGVIGVKGWIVFKQDAPSDLSAAIDGKEIEVAPEFEPQEHDEEKWAAPKVHFGFRLDLRPIPSGRHRLTITVRSRGGIVHAMSASLSVKGDKSAQE